MTAGANMEAVTPPKPMVLVVEDEPQMRRFLRASLTSHGYQLCEAATAAEAVALATSRNPEMVLLDLGLPDEDGVDLTRRLREWSRVPIIVISARGREADKVAVLDAGADDYLTKPFGVGELLARMRVALRHAQQAAGTEAPKGASRRRFSFVLLLVLLWRTFLSGGGGHFCPGSGHFCPTVELFLKSSRKYILL